MSIPMWLLVPITACIAGVLYIFALGLWLSSVYLTWMCAEVELKAFERILKIAKAHRGFWVYLERRRSFEQWLEAKGESDAR